MHISCHRRVCYKMVTSILNAHGMNILAPRYVKIHNYLWPKSLNSVWQFDFGYVSADKIDSL